MAMSEEGREAFLEGAENEEPVLRGNVVLEGAYAYGGGQVDFVQPFGIDVGADGAVQGAGLDQVGPYTLTGTMRGNRLVLLKQYIGKHKVWRHLEFGLFAQSELADLADELGAPKVGWFGYWYVSEEWNGPDLYWAASEEDLAAPKIPVAELWEKDVSSAEEGDSDEDEDEDEDEGEDEDRYDDGDGDDGDGDDDDDEEDIEEEQDEEELEEEEELVTEHIRKNFLKETGNAPPMRVGHMTLKGKYFYADGVAGLTESNMSIDVGYVDPFTIEITAKGNVRGAGTDQIGDYEITGKARGNRMVLLKRYEAGHGVWRLLEYSEFPEGAIGEHAEALGAPSVGWFGRWFIDAAMGDFKPRWTWHEGGFDIYWEIEGAAEKAAKKEPEGAPEENKELNIADQLNDEFLEDAEETKLSMVGAFEMEGRTFDPIALERISEDPNREHPFSTGPFKLEISPDGAVSGLGKDALGSFKLGGAARGERMALCKEYEHGLMVWRHLTYGHFEDGTMAKRAAALELPRMGWYGRWFKMVDLPGWSLVFDGQDLLWDFEAGPTNKAKREEDKKHKKKKNKSLVARLFCL